MSAKDRPVSEQERLALENARLRGDLLTIASRVSHDLRTPLGGMVSTGEMLKEILAEHAPSSETLTDSLFTSIDEMGRFIKQISFVARATANPVPKKTVNMGGVVFGVLQRLESRLLKRGATVAEPASWPEVEGVADWLEWIWWNLLANAIQHGGPKIQLGWLREEKEHRFWISDNGNGVPIQSRAKLFQAFDSLHKPDSARGVGLSIVQRLVELQGGRCGYEVKTERGPSFYFTLPDFDG